MQAEEKGTGTDSCETQLNVPHHHDNNHNSGEMSGNPHESQGAGMHKSPGGIPHENHQKAQIMRTEEKSLDHGQHEKMKHEGYEQQEEMKHEQHSEMKHEQHEGMKHENHEGMGQEGHAPAGGKGHSDHHTHMLEDFRKRFIVSFILTFPVLLLSPMIQGFFGFEISFPGADLIVFLISSVVYFYGGYPFLKGIKQELSEKSPGMMTLIAIAITVAYFYSSAVVFGLHGEVFFLGTGNSYRYHASRALA
jgi:Cu2+-exporting ATPase